MITAEMVIITPVSFVKIRFSRLNGCWVTYGRPPLNYRPAKPAFFKYIQFFTLVCSVLKSWSPSFFLQRQVCISGNLSIVN